MIFDSCVYYRNLDRRRETSRYAARDRRGKEADIFTDLKEVVPIVEEATVTHVDRIALLRVASTMFRLRKHASKLLKTNLSEESSGLWAEATILESLDGFVAIIDSDGVILYVTESVSIYLGLTQNIVALYFVYWHPQNGVLLNDMKQLKLRWQYTHLIIQKYNMTSVRGVLRAFPKRIVQISFLIIVRVYTRDLQVL
ncbi:unnamed protein product [Toxocara canis]|uniref:BHLH domain-containing protein n=1 Tax=Toxocara canis TaxID=6265 RepID=A0A183UZN2_TOXCA|nr:unnamed protein product [Toxocara canis]